MEKPYNRHFNTEQQTTILYFKEREDMECRVRGGICFPMFVENPEPGVYGDVYGYVVLGCEDINTGIVYIFEHKPFHVVDNIVEDSKIIHEGISSWLNMCWSRYYCRKFFYSQEYELSRKFRLDIHRSPMIQPKPEIIEIEAYTEPDRQRIIWERIKTKTIRYEKDSDIHRLIGLMRRGDKTVRPEIYALQVLLCGLDRFPYRKRET